MEGQLLLYKSAISVFLSCASISFPLHGITLPSSQDSENLDQIESVSKAFLLEEANAPAALQNIKTFFNTNKALYFKKLSEGSFNPPALVFYLDGNDRVPLGVLKFEQDRTSAEKRTQMLDDLIERGCNLIPRALRSEKGECLVDLGGKLCSCIEYIEPDDKRLLSFEQMLQLTSKLHAGIRESQLAESHFRKTLDWFSDVSHIILNVDPQLMEWDPSIFTNLSSGEMCTIH